MDAGGSVQIQKEPVTASSTCTVLIVLYCIVKLPVMALRNALYTSSCSVSQIRTAESPFQE